MAKIKLKSLKKGPIRKVKAAVASGAIAAALIPVIKPIVEGWLGVEVEGSFIREGIILLIDSGAYIAAIVGAYTTSPGIEDMPVKG